MRPIELLLTIFLVVSACSLVWRRLLPYLCLLIDLCLLVLHLLLEGGHWQMIPVYTGLLVFAAALALQKRGWRITASVAVALLCAASAGLSVLLPMFRLPAPTGSYPVGTRVMDVSAGGRDVVVQVWYPAAVSRQPFAAYRRREETTQQSSYQDVLSTHSRLDAPVAHGSFPVLLFSPAWGGRRTQNTYLVEDLASHGYVVASMDHPGNSGPAAHRDGQVDQPATGDAVDFGKLTLDQINTNAAIEVERETADELGVLDALAGMNQDRASPFYQRLDLTRVGALGHSMGGAVGAEAAIEDGRVKAVLDMDGSLFSRMQREGLPKPFMIIEQDLPVYADPAKRSAPDLINDALNASDLEAMKKFGAYRIFLHGSTHESFTDHSLFSPVARLSGAGRIPKYREYEILRGYTLAFFDKALRGEDPALLKKVPGPYPEATMVLIPAEKPGT